MRPVNRPHDPAPSRWSYRWHRFWLTPGVRFMTRRGLPMLVVLALAAGYFADPARRAAFLDELQALKRAVEERPEFRVELMRIDGASDRLAADIRDILPVRFPISSFDLDLASMQQAVEALDAVDGASLRIETGGVLAVAVRERVPALVWRTGGDVWLIDAEGYRVTPVERRTMRSDLPLIAGQGADTAAAEALALFRAGWPIIDRIRGLVRIGGRRWDVVLTDGQVIQLPENGAIPALERVIALHDAQDLLGRDVSVIDMRNGARATLRMRPSAIETLRLLWAQEHGEDA